jgi:hypothetical protein
MSSTRSAPAEYNVVPLVAPGTRKTADVVLVDVDAVARHDAGGVDGAVELLHGRNAAGGNQAVVEQVAVVAQRFIEAVEGGRVARVTVEREDRDAAVDVGGGNAKAIRTQRERAAVEIIEAVEYVDGAQALGGALVDHDERPAAAQVLLPLCGAPVFTVRLPKVYEPLPPAAVTSS